MKNTISTLLKGKGIVGRESYAIYKEWKKLNNSRITCTTWLNLPSEKLNNELFVKSKIKYSTVTIKDIFGKIWVVECKKIKTTKNGVYVNTKKGSSFHIIKSEIINITK